MLKKIMLTGIMVFLSIGMAASGYTGQANDLQTANKMLDNFHQYAANANESKYMGLIAKDGFYLGTDASELWTKKDFHKYVTKYFSKGIGWKYLPKDRNIRFNDSKTIGWFFERLFNQSYGELRGTGVIVKIKKKWIITQYNMMFPIPNRHTKKVVEMISKDL